MSDYLPRPDNLPKSLNCLNPVKILVNGQSMFVPCGKCKACQLRKGYRLTNMINLEAKSHQFMEFILLTYSDDNVPLLVPNLRSEDYLNGKHLYNYDFYDYESGEQIISNLRLYGIEKILQKAKSPISGTIPYLCKRDIQLFIKRYRQIIARKGLGSVRFFVVGEYGPSTLRPHFHLILWFDECQQKQQLAENIHLSWKLGYTNSQSVSTDVAQYVSSYVSGHFGIYSLHNHKAVRQFHLHSQHLGENFTQRLCGKSSYPTFSRLNDIDYSSNGQFKPLVPPFSYISATFPRCYRFSTSNFSYNLARYLFSYSVKKLESPSQTAHYLLRSLLDLKLPFVIIDKLSRLFEINYDEISTCGPDGYTRLHNRLRNALCCSDKFIQLCDKYHFGPSTLLRKIEQYYNDYDYNNLITQLYEQETFNSDPSFVRDNLSAWYPSSDDVVPVITSDLKTQYDNYISSVFYSRIKTRKDKESLSNNFNFSL